MPPPACTSWCGHNHHKNVGFKDKFPIGLRVFIVNDDPICLRILEQMLHQRSCTGFTFLPILVFRVLWSRIRVLKLMVQEFICIQHNEVSRIAVDFFLPSSILCRQMFTLSSTTLTSSVLSSRMVVNGWTGLQFGCNYSQIILVARANVSRT